MLFYTAATLHYHTLDIFTPEAQVEEIQANSMGNLCPPPNFI